MWLLIPAFISIVGMVISVGILELSLLFIFGGGLLAFIITVFWYYWEEDKPKKNIRTIANGPDGFQLFNWGKMRWENISGKHFFEFLMVCLPMIGIFVGPAICIL